MAIEIERKFLVKDNSYLDLSTQKIEIAQGYLSIDPDRTVRIRVAGNEAFLTVKTRNSGAMRHEWEFKINPSEAWEILNEAAEAVLEKTRYLIPDGNGLIWEVDCFHGRLEGLVIAEIELPERDANVILPSFVGEEVTGNPRYYNSNLVSQA